MLDPKKNLKIAAEVYCGFSVERRTLLGCDTEIKIKQINVNSKYVIYYLSANIFHFHYRMKSVWPSHLKYIVLSKDGEWL